jgi:murein DD-endopeptidase MepM/ murein hydrolase activator NlpD
VVNYGEVSPDSLSRLGLRVGSKVEAGQTVAFIGECPGGSSMLHFETYTSETTKNSRWLQGQPPPDNVLNPTKYLLFLSQNGLTPSSQVYELIDNAAYSNESQ